MVKIETKFENAIQHQDTAAIATLIHKNLESKITATKIEEIAKKLHYSPLEHAVKSCKKTWCVSVQILMVGFEIQPHHFLF